MLWVRSAAKLLTAAGLLFVLGGCALTQIGAETSKKVVREKDPPPQPGLQHQRAEPRPGGVYKVGNPYQVAGVWYYPKEEPYYDETGIASWYGPQFHGKPTANGEIFDMNEITAAHKTLPMPVMARVTNLENGRSLVVRINDRGPFVNGRIIDLSRRSAQLLGLEGKGTAMVRVQVLAPPSGGEGPMIAKHAESAPEERQALAAAPRIEVASESLAPPPGVTQVSASVRPLDEAQVTYGPASGGRIFVQTGAFSEPVRANAMVQRLRPVATAFVQPVQNRNQTLYRVRIGPFAAVEQADGTLERVIASGIPEARIVIDK